MDGQNWTSTPATGSIVATINGTGATAVTAGYAPGTKAVELPSGPYFVVPQANNPLTNANSITLVALFKPAGPGANGGGFYQGSGLLGMEVAGVTGDWGLTWNGNRVAASAPGAGVMERSIFSDPLYASDLKVAMFTWNGATGVQQIYVNGVLVSTQTTGVLSPRVAAPFALGAATSGGSNPFNGQIAELRMYNSDETANAATIASDLRNTYATDILLESATISPTGGRFVLVDTTAAQVNAAGNFDLSFDGTEVLDSSVQVSKSGVRTTVTYTTPVEYGSSHGYDLTVPKVSGSVNYFDNGSLPSYKLPLTIPGPAGSVGTWGIREILTGDDPLAPDAGNIGLAVERVLADPAFASTDGSAPVLNHADPDTNDQGGVGNFNNDFPLLSDAAGDQDWVVTGKTQVTITTPGELRTFSIHSDDGFAMRVTGAGGGRFVHVGGDAQIDESDVQTLFRDFGTGDSNSRGTFRFDAAGTYEITYLGYDGGSGGYHEVAWAPGTYFDDRDTNLWRLVGNDTDPSIPAFRERWATNPPGPSSGDGTFGIRTFLNSGATGLGNMTTFLNGTTRTPENDAANTFDAQVPYLNHRDPNNGGFARFIDDRPFPGNNNSNDENNVVTVAKGRISIPTTGTYTFITNSDDGFVFRLKGVNGNPDPAFRRVTSGSGDPRFQMSNPNEVYYDGANNETRAIVDLPAGSYDIEYLQVENVGGFNYELGVATGEWPNQTTPPGGFQLVGVPASTVLFPAIAAPGWTVESSIPGLNQFASNIAGAEAKISYTQGLATNDPIWATLGLNPANRTTTWASLNFNDPQDGGDGNFTPNNPWPLNTTSADNDYAMRATGNIIITQAGYYHLGFQGDDGGYMYIYGAGGNPDPVIDSIVFTHHPNDAKIGIAPNSTVNNAVRTDVGTGNSRTIVRVLLQPGQYQIKTLFFEGGGGSWWEVIGGSETAAYNYPLLSTTAGSAPVNGGLTLIAQSAAPGDPNFKITSVTMTGNPVTSVSFNIAGQPGETYTVEASTNLTDWIELTTSLASTGTSTPFTVNLSEFPQLNGEEKVFFRAVVNQ